MSFSDPYQAYAEGSLAGASPLQLVIALYEGAIDSIRQARLCLAMNDVMGRSAAVNKATSILTELLVSLDHERGGEISANLKRLYSYIQCRVLDAHMEKSEAPLLESERLLRDLLEGWNSAAATVAREWSGTPATAENYEGTSLDEPSSLYGFFAEGMEAFAGSVSATF